MTMYASAWVHVWMNVSPFSKKNGMKAAGTSRIGTSAFSNHGGSFGVGSLPPLTVPPGVLVSVAALIRHPSSARRAGPTA